MSTVTISLPESLKRFVENEVAAAGYGNVSEYFRALLREAQARNLREALDGQLLAVLAVPAADTDRGFWRQLRTEARRLLQEGRASGVEGWPPAIARHRESIEALCRRSAVREFALLGASARAAGETTHEPLECAVHLGDRSGDELAQAYATFSSALGSILQCPIDLIEIGSMGATRLRLLIAQTRRVLYVAVASD